MEGRTKLSVEVVDVGMHFLATFGLQHAMACADLLKLELIFNLIKRKF